MARKANPWFRFYVEAIGDRKLRRLSYLQRWIWVSILAAASDSPIRGVLLVAEDIPMTIDELAEFAGVKPADVRGTLEKTTSMHMVTIQDDGLIRVTNWDKRQYESDNVTARTRTHRERSKERSKEQPDDVPRNVRGNAPETETETETEQGTTWGGERPVPLAPVAATTPPPDEPPRCSRHPNGNPGNEPCAGCARVREYRDKTEARDRERRVVELEQAKLGCPDCEGTGKVLAGEDRHPTRRTCDHPKVRRSA